MVSAGCLCVAIHTWSIHCISPGRFSNSHQFIICKRELASLCFVWRHMANVITRCATWKGCTWTSCQWDVIQSADVIFLCYERCLSLNCLSNSQSACLIMLHLSVSELIHLSCPHDGLATIIHLKHYFFWWFRSVIHSCFHAILLCTAAVTEDPVFATRAESWTVLWRLTAQCQSDWKWQHWPAFSGEPLASVIWQINGLFPKSVPFSAVGDNIGITKVAVIRRIGGR